MNAADCDYKRRLSNYNHSTCSCLNYATSQVARIEDVAASYSFALDLYLFYFMLEFAYFILGLMQFTI